jgi:hypothetical protein
VAGALRGEEALGKGLSRYRRRHARGLGGHAAMIHGYANGRRLNRGERVIFSAAAHDERAARVVEAFGSRNIGPARMLATATPLALAAHARRAVTGRGRTPRQRSAGEAHDAAIAR